MAPERAGSQRRSLKSLISARLWPGKFGANPIPRSKAQARERIPKTQIGRRRTASPGPLAVAFRAD